MVGGLGKETSRAAGTPHWKVMLVTGDPLRCCDVDMLSQHMQVGT